MKNKTLISIVGPTAVGKTSTAIEIAKLFGAEIISSDSRQFFKELTIGTAKPTIQELAEVPHHFINNRSIQENYNASLFEEEVIPFLDQYFEEKNVVVMCGGSGMYVDAVLRGFDENVPTADTNLRKELNVAYVKNGITYLQELLKKLDPEAFQAIDTKNSKRLLRAIEIVKLTGKPNSQIKKGIAKKRNFNFIEIGLELPRPQLYNRINKRVDLMIDEGLLQEAIEVEPFKALNALKTVGYKEIYAFRNNEYSWETAVEKIKTNSRRYAKRQLTWFKKNDNVQWYSPKEINKISKYIRTIIEQP